MNVSELSDEELNRAMIWLNPPKNIHYDKDGYNGVNYHHHRQGIGYSWLNYLTDWSLTGPLMIDNNIELMPFVYSDCGEWRAYQIKKSTNRHSINKNPLRAICEVNLMINSNK